ncbi:MAG: hypothetical protein Kow0042_28990 [Calditrichia bacterium]
MENKSHGEKKKTATSRRTTAQKQRKEKTEKSPPKSEGGNKGKKESPRTDQLSAIVSKGFDLAEASITLGINLVNRLGSVAQEKLIEKVTDMGRSFTAGGEPPNAGDTAYPGEQEPESAGEQSPGVMYIQNRLPLFPGSPVQVSFSLSNDSPTTPKKLKLRLEGFVGQMQGMVIDGKGFSIKPASKVIAPMDFDKFTLVGQIPQQAVSDHYAGWILVSGEEELKIPVRLIVTAET